MWRTLNLHQPLARFGSFADGPIRTPRRNHGRALQNHPLPICNGGRANDYAGHAFGPYSPELLDLTLRTDLQLGAFLKFLDGKVEGGLKNGVVFALTADHGVFPIPELGDHPLSKHLARAIHSTLSGDLLILPEQLYLFEEMGPAYATTHGTPYVYDIHVPVMMSGPGIRAGVYLDRVAPTDIAPTLSLLLGIEYPSACDGRPLQSALSSRD